MAPKNPQPEKPFPSAGQSKPANAAKSPNVAVADKPAPLPNAPALPEKPLKDPAPVKIKSADPIVARPVDINSLLQREYVSGGLYSWLATYYRALPHYIDDITSEFGDDLYDRMMLDPKVSACVNLIKYAVLADGVNLINPIQDENDPNHEKAQEILEFCQRNLDNLKEPLTSTLWQLLDALPYGHKLAEKIYYIPKTGPDKGKMCLKAIKVKPRRVTAMVVDAYQNVVAVLGLLPGQGPSSLLTAGLIGVGDAKSGGSYTPANLLNRDKFIIFSWRPKDGDPRGTSILRAAYTPWWFKQQTYPELISYLTRFGSPSIIGRTPEGALEQPVYDGNGNTIPDPTSPTGIQMNTPEALLLTQLLNFRNGYAMTTPAGTEFEIIQASGNGEAFMGALERYDKEISQAILHQTLATEEAQFQAKASSETHQDVLSLVITYAKQDTAQVIKNDLIWQLVSLNFGDEIANTLCPNVQLAEMEKADFAQNATSISQLYSSGYLHDSQLPELDAMLGLPERDMEQIALENQQKMQMQQAQLEAHVETAKAAAAGKLAAVQGAGQQPPNGQKPGQTNQPPQAGQKPVAPPPQAKPQKGEK